MSDPKNFVVELKASSPFAAIFDRALVPLKLIPFPNAWTTRGTPLMGFASRALCGESAEPECVYWLDWSRVSPEQRAQLALAVCALRGGEPNEFLSYMDRGGDMPIRATQTIQGPFPT